MKRYRVTNTKLVAGNILLLTIQPKRSRDMLDFYPGQYAAVGFEKHGRPSPMRCFSIISSPNETDLLQFAIRVQGDFTNTLANLEVGDNVFIEGPFGNFVLDEQFDKNVIMLAAGIGVTPFISMLRYSSEAQLYNRFTLLYSSQSQDGIALHEEIRQMENDNSKFKAAYFITKGGIDKLHDHHALVGRIDEARLQKLTSGQFNRFSYFICGPVKFIDSMRDILENNGTEAQRIVSEEFMPSSKLSAVLTPKDKTSLWTYSLTAATLVLGIAFIMTLDLARAIPKITAAQAPAASTSATQTSASSGSSSTASSAPAASSSTNSSSTPSSTSSSQQQTTTSQPSQTYYSAPVTSIS